MIDNEVINFISGFTNNNIVVTNIFSNGYCYWFARILKERFNGSVVYDPIYNHFACNIDDELYDIQGQISKRNYDRFIYWESFKINEPYESARIYRDCILKLPSECEINYAEKTCNGELLKVYNEENDL